jgi:hypothetical protein
VDINVNIRSAIFMTITRHALFPTILCGCDFVTYFMCLTKKKMQYGHSYSTEEFEDNNINNKSRGYKCKH